MKTTPDYTSAAVKAAEVLARFGVDSAPVNPIPMILNTPGVTLVSFTEFADNVGIERKELMKRVTGSPDAFSSVRVEDGAMRYIIAYNKKLGENNHSLHCALAREYGHVVLGHDGSLPQDVRMEEVRCFHHHLLAPRALIHMVQASGIRLTTSAMSFITGCNDQCLSSMRTLPEVRVPAELNRAVRDNFLDFFFNHFEFQRANAVADGSALADFGTYMKGYEE